MWLGPRLDEAREATYGPSQPGFAWYDLARQLRDDAVVLEENRNERTSTILLECTAAALLIRAHLARDGLPTGGGPLEDADLEKAQRVEVIANAWNRIPSAHASTFAALLGREREGVLAHMSTAERRALAVELHSLVSRLSAPLDFDASQLKLALFARWARLILVALTLLVGLGMAARWLDAKFAKPNIALGRPVTTSSQYPGAGENPARLVDGDRENLGFHTNADGQQWVVIDLGAIRSFDRVAVYNRAEGQHKRAVPLRLEISDDGQNYRLLRERQETFAVWTAKRLHAKGRYVRLRNAPNNYFHLSEVEIY